MTYNGTRLIKRPPVGLGELDLASVRATLDALELKVLEYQGTLEQQGLGDFNDIINGIGSVVGTVVGVAQSIVGISGSGASRPWKSQIDSWYNRALGGDGQAESMLRSYDWGDAMANAYQKSKVIELSARRIAGQVGVGLIGQSNVGAVASAQLYTVLPWLIGGGLLFLFLRRR